MKKSEAKIIAAALKIEWQKGWSTFDFADAAQVLGFEINLDNLLGDWVVFSGETEVFRLA